MDKDLIYQDPNLVLSEASNSGEVSSCQNDHLVGLNEPSTEEISPVHDASNSKNASSCRFDDLKQIKDQLIAEFPSKLKIIPIVGMGGIGKTTLAKSIYEDTEISYHFHLRAWITVSQEYKPRNVLLGLLRSFRSLPDEVSELENDQLVEMLYKSLKGMRYLIALDDIWDTEIWNNYNWLFPDDNMGSRIMLTSRLMEVAAYADPDSPPHFMNCLNDKESWRLLRNEVFVGEICPPQLVKIGKQIAEKCQGLPLAIVVVAGYLSKIDKNQDCWADVAKRLDLLITGKQDQVLDILCSSYSCLPQHLKACFLYVGNFPKNSEIHVRKLIRLWSCVGILPAVWSENPEDAANKCLEDLISRNLIMVKKKKYGNGPAKTCGIHDLLWDLILREARKEGHYIFGQSNFRNSHSNAITDDMKYLMSLTSTYLSFRYSFETDFSLTSFCFKVLKVLDIQSEFFYDFPDEITNLVDLRYLELSTRDNIPREVSKLRYLETLINKPPWAVPILPNEIWLLRRLRHLHVGTCTFLPDASGATVDGSCFSIFLYLQTLSTVSFASCTKQVFFGIPNIKQLKISEINGEDDENLFAFLNNLVSLHRLEKLNLSFSKAVRRQQQIRWCDFFPPSVKQLTLRRCNLQWEDMNFLAMLPNLEVLNLKYGAFKGPVYEQTFEGFRKLKVLLVEYADLEQWIANTIHFPVLRHLFLRHCYSLEEIPCCIGEIPTLESIELYECSKSVMKSAKAIQQEQQSMGNYDLQIDIYGTNVVLEVVLKLDLSDDEIRLKVVRRVAGFSGVRLIEVNTKDNTMTVTGDRSMNPHKISSTLGKLCYTEAIFLQRVNEHQKYEEAKKGDDKNPCVNYC